MPGGAAEMAILGEKYGALPDRVALAHSMRMLFVVTVVPGGHHARGLLGHGRLPARSTLAFDAAGLAMLFALALAIAGSSPGAWACPTPS